MINEEQFLRRIYSEYSRGTLTMQWVSHKILTEVRWNTKGSTTRAKHVISSFLRVYTNSESEFEEASKTMIYDRITVLEEVLNKIIEFQSQPYIKGGF